FHLFSCYFRKKYWKKHRSSPPPPAASRVERSCNTNVPQSVVDELLDYFFNYIAQNGFDLIPKNGYTCCHEMALTASTNPAVRQILQFG
ncbi:MAG: hypothetical protein OXF20_02170, partial [Gammaproteobacteria bacterium]|nr:hypothetical protein [Gammaproteobacteria bacterium]